MILDDFHKAFQEKQKENWRQCGKVTIYCIKSVKIADFCQKWYYRVSLKLSRSFNNVRIVKCTILHNSIKIVLVHYVLKSGLGKRKKITKNPFAYSHPSFHIMLDPSNMNTHEYPSILVAIIKMKCLRSRLQMSTAQTAA